MAAEVTVAELVARLRADTTQFSRGLQQAERSTSAFRTGIEQAGRVVKNFGDKAGGTFAAVALSAVVMGQQVVRTGIQMNAQLEKTTLQFQILMGSAKQAEQHVMSLFRFAGATPFETQPILEASRLLQTFGGTALNTEESLRLVGDAAAAVSAPIERVGFYVGRMYSALKGGRPIGEAAIFLQEMGVLTATARNQIEAAASSAGSFAEKWAVVEEVLGQFNGAMKIQAQTWEGLTSTLSDLKDLSIAQVFDGFYESAKRLLSAIIALGQTPFFKDMLVRFESMLAPVNTVIDKMAAGITNLAKNSDRFMGVFDKGASAAAAMTGEFAELTGVTAGLGAAFAGAALSQLPFVGGLFNMMPLPGKIGGSLIGLALANDEVRDSFADVGRALVPVIERVMPPLLKGLDALLDLVADVAPELADLAVAVIEVSLPFMELAAQTLPAVLAIVTPVVNAFADLLQAIQPVLPVVIAMVAAWKPLLVMDLAAKLLGIGRAATMAGEGAKTMGAGMSALRGSLTALANPVTAVGAGILAVFSAFESGRAQDAAEWFSNAFGDVDTTNLDAVTRSISAINQELARESGKYLAPGEVLGPDVDLPNESRIDRMTEELERLRDIQRDLAVTQSRATTAAAQYGARVDLTADQVTRLADAAGIDLSRGILAVDEDLDTFIDSIRGTDEMARILGMDLDEMTGRLGEQAGLWEVSAERAEAFRRAMTNSSEDGDLQVLRANLDVVAQGLANVGDAAMGMSEDLTKSITSSLNPMSALGIALDTARTRLDEVRAAGGMTDDEFTVAMENMGASAADFTAELAQQNQDLINWAANLRAIAQRGFGELATDLARLGPEAASSVANFVNATDAELSAMEDQFALSGALSGGEFVNALATELATMETLARDMGIGTVDELADALNIAPDDVREIFGEAGDEADEVLRVMVANARTQGRATADELADGLGMQVDEVRRIANQYFSQLAGAARIYLASIGLSPVPGWAERANEVSRGGNVRSFADGGIEHHVAQIAPAGAWRVWAEPETGGEAYIPLAKSKRSQSLAILKEVSKHFGLGLLPYPDLPKPTGMYPEYGPNVGWPTHGTAEAMHGGITDAIVTLLNAEDGAIYGSVGGMDPMRYASPVTSSLHAETNDTEGGSVIVKQTNHVYGKPDRWLQHQLAKGARDAMDKTSRRLRG